MDLWDMMEPDQVALDILASCYARGRDISRSLAGGVNQFVIHVYPYSGYYPNTTWPGFTTFTYLFSEHGRHQPAWDFYRDSTDYVARNQYVFQSGVPKVDLAFYSKVTSYATIQSFYQPNDLVEAGYTYEYILLDDFSLPEAYVTDGVFAPERQSFKAMIVRANDSMTVQGVEELVEYARAGLPIVFSGGVPSYLVSYNASGDAYANSALQSLVSLDNVHVVPYDKLTASIAALGIKPRTTIAASSIWYTYWRREEEAKADYVFVYNDALGAAFNMGRSQGTVEFASTGTPYFYSAWTGDQTRILNYTQAANTTSIWLALAGNQSVIVAFHNDGHGRQQHGHGKESDHPALETKTGDAIILENWTLIAEHWDPPANLSDIDLIAVKHNTTHHLPQLVSWQAIPGLQNVSGLGYYNTTFNWTRPTAHSHKSSQRHTAITIDFGAIVHTIHVSINGHRLPPLDLAWVKADIMPYLVDGKNAVEAVVATTLYNRLKPMRTELETCGVFASFMDTDEEPSGPFTDPSRDYGLLNAVIVTPYTVTLR
ncbi:Uu.00g145510.m01.CDS01 [Anthostomella pinea]|uniref:Uu.00g145510.m01.CDS01 n=1 Tax=Anthostomella pinea TaxID=933095 RepID=A0AAI8VR35_9PEZI|nr:Uu.00g145510.m01.CDS01 [Anthostomella pinea]